MSQDIAHFSLNEALDTAAKWFRVMLSTGVSLGALMRPINHKGSRENLKKFLEAGCPNFELVGKKAQAEAVISETDQFLTVEADLAFEDRIKLGNYGWRNSDLTEKRFPVTADQVGEWEWKLFHFNRNISSKEAIRLMKEEGYDAGQIGHILAFGEKYPEEQRKFPIIGLGSVARVGLLRDVPALWGDGDGRGLGLDWFDGDWRDYYRFLGVRRRSESFGA